MRVTRQLITNTERRSSFGLYQAQYEIDMVDDDIRLTFTVPGSGRQMIYLKHNEAVELVRDLVLYLKEDKE